MLMRFALACDASQATSSQCKAYLGAVVVGLYAGNGTEAWATYQVSIAVDCLKSCSGINGSTAAMSLLLVVFHFSIGQQWFQFSIRIGAFILASASSGVMSLF